MLIFPLRKEWYEKIKSGEKTVEYREAKPYWAKRLLRAEYSDFCATRVPYKERHRSIKVMRRRFEEI